MLYVFLGMSLLFIAIAFILNKDNAKHLLSGYNTMSEENKKQFDLNNYLKFFRKFHLFLGASLLIIGLPLNYLVSESAGGLFIGIYPIAAYIYFTAVSSRYSKGMNIKWNKIGIVILVVTLLFVIGLLGYGFKESKLVFNTESIEITGFYGETLNTTKIKSIRTVEKLPAIRYKSNGFALGIIRKGYFKTTTGETVKLMLNSDNTPYLLITKADGKKIYFTAKSTSTIELLNYLKNSLPDVEYQY